MPVGVAPPCPPTARYRGGRVTVYLPGSGGGVPSLLSAPTDRHPPTGCVEALKKTQTEQFKNHSNTNFSNLRSDTQLISTVLIFHQKVRRLIYLNLSKWIAFLIQRFYPKRLTIFASYSPTHTPTAASTVQGDRRLVGSCWGSGVLRRDTSTLNSSAHTHLYLLIVIFLFA